MKVALVNPRWSFEGSIYFGCREPHLPLELGYARALLEAILEDTPPGPTRRDALRLLAEVRFNEQGFAGIVPLLEEALEGAGDPARAVAIALPEISVPRRSICHPAQRAGCSANIMASESTSCPVEQPADQIVRRRVAARSRTSSGST